MKILKAEIIGSVRELPRLRVENGEKYKCFEIFKLFSNRNTLLQLKSAQCTYEYGQAKCWS